MEDVNKGMMIVRLLQQIREGIRQTVEHEFKDLKLTGPQGMVFGILAHHGDLKISDLSKRLGLSNSTVSGIVDRLERQGLVERVRDKEDRRVVYVSIAPVIKAKVDDKFDQVGERIQGLLNGTTAEEVDKILEGLNLLKELIERKQQENEIEIKRGSK